MMMVFAAMAQLECDMIMIRQVEGIQIAKAEGKYKGRKRIKLDEKLFFSIFHMKRGQDISPIHMPKVWNFAQHIKRRVREVVKQTNNIHN